jgi:small conductance mechanosensitive channel
MYAILLLLLLLPVPASAEPPGVAPSVDELQRLVETLHDEKARAQLVSQLQALIAAQRGAKAPEEAASPMGWLSQGVDQVIGEILTGASVLVDAPRVVAWGRAQLEDETARRRWLDIGVALLVIFGCAVVAEWFVRRFLLRLLPRAPTRRGDTRDLRLLYRLFDLVIGTLPIIAFAAVAYLVLPMTLPAYSVSRTSVALLVWATVIARLILAAARSMLLPSDDNIGFVSASEETRNYLYIWVKRFTCWSVFGLPSRKALGGCPADLRPDAEGRRAGWWSWRRLRVAEPCDDQRMDRRPGGSADRPAHSELAPPRRRLAETWHVPAIVYVLVFLSTRYRSPAASSTCCARAL